MNFTIFKPLFFSYRLLIPLIWLSFIASPHSYQIQADTIPSSVDSSNNPVDQHLKIPKYRYAPLFEYPIKYGKRAVVISSIISSGVLIVWQPSLNDLYAATNFFYIVNGASFLIGTLIGIKQGNDQYNHYLRHGTYKQV